MKKLKPAPQIKRLSIVKKMEFIENSVQREKVNKRIIPTAIYIARRAGNLNPIELAKYFHIDPKGLNSITKRYALYLMENKEEKAKIEGMILEASVYFNGHNFDQIKQKEVIVEQPVIQVVDLFGMGLKAGA